MAAAKTIPECLSAKFPEQFANVTIRERLPVILTQIADHVHRKKQEVLEELGQDGVEDLKFIAGRMSKLKNEVQTNKPVIPIEDGRSDTVKWNKYLEKEIERVGSAPCWFESAWLYVECYMYRRIQEAVELSTLMKTLDVFGEQKRQGFMSSQSSIITLLSHLSELLPAVKDFGTETIQDVFRQYVQVCLWGNKCDLSISAGAENFQKSDPIEQVQLLKSNILRDDTDELWVTLTSAQKARPGKVRLDIVLDNAGFELVTDLCLVEMLLAMGLVNTVQLHAKPMPWFVSDVTTEDFDWTLHKFCSSNNVFMSSFGQKWKQYLSDKTWVFKVHDYWCLPFDYSEMKTRAPDLYQDLGHADLILFKGDLNYRKLVGDRNWEPTTPFETGLRGFHPAPLCTMRTLKADVVVGLTTGQAEDVKAKEEKWMTSGNWAVICFSNSKS